jgi:hypothetical protein
MDVGCIWRTWSTRTSRDYPYPALDPLSMYVGGVVGRCSIGQLAGHTGALNSFALVQPRYPMFSPHRPWPHPNGIADSLMIPLSGFEPSTEFPSRFANASVFHSSSSMSPLQSVSVGTNGDAGVLANNQFITLRNHSPPKYCVYIIPTVSVHFFTLNNRRIEVHWSGRSRTRPAMPTAVETG